MGRLFTACYAAIFHRGDGCHRAAATGPAEEAAA